MTKICVVTATWQRPQLVSIMLDSLVAQADRLENQIALDVVVAGSEGESSREIAESRGAAYVEIANLPLGTKWQAALAGARELSPDGVMVLGSDNLVNDKLLLTWKEQLEAGFDYIGLLDTHQYNVAARALVYWPGYGNNRKNEPIGSSRMFSRRLLDCMNWEIWDRSANRSLDWSTTQRLSHVKHHAVLVRQHNSEVRHLGIKTNGALSPSLHKHVKDRVPLDRLSEWFGDVIGSRVLALV